MSDYETPESPKHRSVTRIVGVITGVVVALAVLASAIVPVFLPDRDVAGDRPEVNHEEQLGDGERRFVDQTVNWYPCVAGMDCADVVAPMDWDHPDGDTITLHLTRQQATGGDPIGSLFVNPGGPGSGGAAFIAESIDWGVGEPLQERFDVIGWDPRGTGQSSAVACFDGAAMDEYLFGDPREYSQLETGSDEWLDVARAEARELGETCLDETGPLLEFVDTHSTVRDLDLLRQLVGDEKLNYLGFSYGTFIGALYAESFPDRVGRLVLDGVLAANATMHDAVREQTKGFEAATRAYLEDCLTRAGCPFTGDVDAGMDAIESLILRVQNEPLRGSDGRWVSSGTFLTAIITPLYSQDSWPFLDDLFESIDVGDADVALFLADFYYGRTGTGTYEDNSTEAFYAINCLDYPLQTDVSLMRQQADELKRVAPSFGQFQGFGDVSCSEWPFPGVAERTAVTAEGSDPILVIGTTGDPATPYVWAQELAESLDNGALVTYNGEGHVAYGATANSCVRGAVEQYFLEGIVPAQDPNC